MFVSTWRKHPAAHTLTLLLNFLIPMEMHMMVQKLMSGVCKCTIFVVHAQQEKNKIFYVPVISFCLPRGVILYAMVCGRLPFGDDSQVKKLQSRQLSFSRHVSYGKCVGSSTKKSMFKIIA